MERRTQFFLVPWREHSQPRDQAQHAHVFNRMMGRSERRIGKSGPCSDKNDALMMVAEIEADLLDNTIGQERGDGVTDWTQSARRHTGGDPDHVRLGHAAIEKAPRCDLFELVEEAIPDVTGEQNYVFALLRDCRDFVREGVPHRKS